jgi:hypothetical protein
MDPFDVLFLYFASIEELIKKPPPLRQRPEDVGNFVSNSIYHFSCYGLLFLLLQFRSVYCFMAAMFLH